MKIHKVTKLMNLAQRITEALEKIAKESERQNNLLGGDLSVSTPLEKLMPMAPPLDWHSGRNR